MANDTTAVLETAAARFSRAELSRWGRQRDKPY